MDIHILINIIGVIMLGISCGTLGYVIRMHSELTRQQKQLKEADRRFREVITPMILFTAKLRESGLAYSEEGFQNYLEEQGTSYEQWHAEAELLIGRKI